MSTGLNVQAVSEDAGAGDPRWAAGHPPRERHEETMKAVLTRWGKFVTDASAQAAEDYQFLAGDVAIATHSKSGTTMMQQIVHQLRSNGDMEFGEVTEVVPFMEVALDCELDLSSSQAPHAPPRAFKTHMSWPAVPKNRTDDGNLASKYLYVARDFHSVVVSFYRFLLDWFYTAEEVRLCDFVEVFLYRRSTPYWDHVADYYKAALEEANQGSFYWLFFEDILKDQEGAVRAVAEFIGIRDKCASDEEFEERVKTATEMSSFSFMKENSGHFDERLTKKYRNEVIGAVDGGNGGQKVRAGGREKASVVLDDTLFEEVATVVGDHLQELLGVRTYAELMDKAKRELGNNVFRPRTAATAE
mmetsp:Transcript_16497/g.64354  ORF Transcript_16497/g.64354 Transcript_16497/m.64354 type:complete len:359 (+) Transcript_16497:25-1101(+)